MLVYGANKRWYTNFQVNNFRNQTSWNVHSSKGSDQPAYSRSLKRVFDGRIMGSQWFGASTDGKRSLLSDYVDAQTDLSIFCMHMPT